MGDYTMASSLVAFADESDGSGSADDAEDDDDATTFDDEDDGDVNSSSADEMSTWHSYPLSFVTKEGE